jgi:energy-coupling factor transporter ATP-binding protein EcfA2
VRIESIEYEELDSGWKLSHASFHQGVTLLVGLSGVGKTRILKAIRTLLELATSEVTKLPKSIRWRLEFAARDGARCIWTGETDSEERDSRTDSPSIVHESFTFGGIELFRKTGAAAYFRDVQAPPLSHHLVGFRLFATDPDLARISREFKDFIILHHGQPEDMMITQATWKLSEIEEYKDHYLNLEQLRSSDLSLQHRVFIASMFHPKLFEEMSSRFIEAFSSVESVRVDRYPLAHGVFLLLSFEEKHVRLSFGLHQLSSGMMNTFLLIAYSYLCPDGTVILIDEFESSMGMNCLNEATDLVLETSRRMQFILTSHHPYVINNIRPECWKVVSRNGGNVTTRDATEIGIGTSRHAAFTQLMNSKEYAEGILSE